MAKFETNRSKAERMGQRPLKWWNRFEILFMLAPRFASVTSMPSSRRSTPLRVAELVLVAAAEKA